MVRVLGQAAIANLGESELPFYHLNLECCSALYSDDNVEVLREAQIILAAQSRQQIKSGLRADNPRGYLPPREVGEPTG